jgi:hypothetical protein
LPIAVECFWDEFVESVPRHSACGHVVHQASEVVRERERRRRIAGDERCFVFLARRNARGPPEHELRQQQPPLEPANRHRQIERRAGERARRRLREGDLVLIDVADGHDARQDRGAGLGHVEEHIADQPAGTPRGQIEGGVRKRKRTLAGRKARHQGSIHERADQRRHEGR